MRELPDQQRAERLARLEAALATDPPEDLAKRLGALIACYQPPPPLTHQESIDRRFSGDHERQWPYTCGTDGTECFPGDYWHLCAHSALLKIASALDGRPAIAATTLEKRDLRDVDFGGIDSGYSIGFGRLGDATGTCTCPHDCAWSGPLREMWIQVGTSSVWAAATPAHCRRERMSSSECRSLTKGFGRQADHSAAFWSTRQSR